MNIPPRKDTIDQDDESQFAMNQKLALKSRLAMPAARYRFALGFDPAQSADVPGPVINPCLRAS
jgi:hypothetical protein